MAENQLDIRITAQGGDQAAAEVSKVTAATDRQTAALRQNEAATADAAAKWDRSPLNPKNAPPAASPAGSTLPGRETGDAGPGVVGAAAGAAAAGAVVLKLLNDELALREKITKEIIDQSHALARQDEEWAKTVRTAASMSDVARVAEKSKEQIDSLREKLEVLNASTGSWVDKLKLAAAEGAPITKISTAHEREIAATKEQIAIEETKAKNRQRQAEENARAIEFQTDAWRRYDQAMKEREAADKALAEGLALRLNMSREAAAFQEREDAKLAEGLALRLNMAREAAAFQEREGAKAEAAIEAEERRQLEVGSAEQLAAEKQITQELEMQMRLHNEAVERQQEELLVLREKAQAFADEVAAQMQLVAGLQQEAAAQRAAQMAESKSPVESRETMERHQARSGGFQSQAGGGIEALKRPMDKSAFAPRLKDAVTPKMSDRAVDDEDESGKSDSKEADAEVKKLQETMKAIQKALEKANKDAEKTKQEAEKLPPKFEGIGGALTGLVAKVDSIQSQLDTTA